MEHKIFLGKYRVAADEIAQVATEPSAVPAASEPNPPTRLYRGQEIDSGREVAVEVIPATALKNSVREKLEAEATAAKQLSHVNIPALYDFGLEDNQVIYVTEYFDGTSAEEWVNQHGAMPTGAVLRIALQVIGAMGAASFHKISHHAINPGNLILVPGQTPEGDWPLIKVLHFVGVAPTFQEADTSVASFDKSTHYASPEQIQHGKVDFRSEIYSLGATMWFLLTGAPPLMAPKGPLAMQPTTIGLAVDKLSGMPKRVRRLLAQMLATNPVDRPQDPLALYRQIQDCVAQVDRRESMARRFGVPFLSGSNVVALPSRRRFPVKTVALAAAILAMAIAAAVMIPQYLRHQRIRQAQEPIGVPIGVPETTQSAPPVTASAPTIAPAPPQPEQTANTVQTVQTSSIQNPTPVRLGPKIQNAEAPPVTASAPTIKPLPTAPEQTVRATVAEQKQPPPPTEPTPQTAPIQNPKSKIQNADVAANNQPAAPPPQPTQPEPTVTSEPPTVAANETKPVIDEPSKPAVNEPKEKPANTETQVAATTARAVTPEVRRAKPAPPAEGPEEVAPPTTEKKVATTAKPKKEKAKKPKREFEEEAIPRAEPVEDEEVAERPLPQLPGGRTRARFIGVTADGNWMFSLPNKKIVIVPPPPGG